MGNSNSDDNKNKKGKTKDKNDGDGGGDGFFGNFKWRILVIGILLIVFAVLQLPLISDSLDSYSQANKTCRDLCDFWPSVGQDECREACNDAYSDELAALSFVEIGLLLMIIGSICAIVINLLNCNDCCGNCDNCLLMFVMVTLIAGGAFYLIGSWYWIGETSAGFSVFGIFVGAGGCDFDPDTASNMLEMISVCESFLGGVTAIVFGVDCWKQILNQHKIRMYAQSIILLIFISFFCFIGYAYFGSNCSDGVDETRLIAAGYFFILIACIVYLVMSFASCCSKIQQMVSQIVIALILIIGGIFAGIGYWGNTYPDVAGAEEYNSFVTGYVVLLIGICVVNALDMGLYDNAKAAKTASSTAK